MKKFKVKITNSNDFFEISPEPNLIEINLKKVEELSTAELLGIIKMRLKKQVELGNLDPNNFYDHISNTIEP